MVDTCTVIMKGHGVHLYSGLIAMQGLEIVHS